VPLILFQVMDSLPTHQAIRWPTYIVEKKLNPSNTYISGIEGVFHNEIAILIVNEEPSQ
jgi:hypothetical protein